CMVLSASTTLGLGGNLLMFSSGLPPPAPGPVRFTPAWGAEGLALAAAASKSATEGILEEAMFCRALIISAQSSKVLELNSGLRTAWANRDCPVFTRAFSRRPLSRSARAWVSRRRRLLG